MLWNTVVRKQLTLKWNSIPTMLNMITFCQYSTFKKKYIYFFQISTGRTRTTCKVQGHNCSSKKHNNTNYCCIGMNDCMLVWAVMKCIAGCLPLVICFYLKCME